MAEVLADRAHDHLAGVEAHADREAEPLLAAELRRVGGELLLLVKRRVAGALGVVLVGDRGAEQGHDAVAGELVDRALEAVDARRRGSAKKRSMICRHSSGSLCSASSIEPITSANSTVTCLRSPSRAPWPARIFSARCSGTWEPGSGGAAGPPIAAAAAPAAAVSSWPQALQNFWPAGFEAPQLGHGDAPASGVAQLPQNRASDGLG